MDLFPTLCEKLAMTPPSSVHGKSFAGVLDAGAGKHRDKLFYAYTEGQKAVRDSRYKLIEYSVPKQPRVTQLFDMQEDPEETRNLADDASHAATLAHIRDALKNWSIGVGKVV